MVGQTAISSAAGELGTQLKTSNYALQLGCAKTLKNSKYLFVMVTKNYKINYAYK